MNHMLNTAICLLAVWVAVHCLSTLPWPLLSSQPLARHRSDAPLPDKVHDVAQRQLCAVVSPLQLLKLSESYWRDTWHHLSSAPFPGHCCCCACASYQNSDTAYALSPGGIIKQIRSYISIIIQYHLTVITKTSHLIYVVKQLQNSQYACPNKKAHLTTNIPWRMKFEWWI